MKLNRMFSNWKFLIATASVLALLLLLPISRWYVESVAKGNHVPDGLPDYSLVIAQGEGASTLVDQLSNAGFVSNPLLLKLYIKLNPVLGQNLQAGEYRVLAGSNWIELLESFRHGSFEEQFTFLEGWRREEYAQYLVGQKGTEYADEFWMLSDGLEGYLFPDTYFIDDQTTPAKLISKMSTNFNLRTSDLKLMEQQERIGLSEKEVVVLASLIEREVHDDADRAIVAGILLRRLSNGWPLEIDATVQYALASRAADVAGVVNAIKQTDFNWWPSVLTEEDLKTDSTYNTRQFVGLPPAPICNPGREAMDAVVNPVMSEYWFYLTDSNGITRYAVTLEEHNQNITRFGVAQ